MRFTSSGRTGEIILKKKTIFKAWKRKHLRRGRETFGKQDNEETVGWKKENDKQAEGWKWAAVPRTQEEVVLCNWAMILRYLKLLLCTSGIWDYFSGKLWIFFIALGFSNGADLTECVCIHIYVYMVHCLLSWCLTMTRSCCKGTKSHSCSVHKGRCLTSPTLMLVSWRMAWRATAIQSIMLESKRIWL